MNSNVRSLGLALALLGSTGATAGPLPVRDHFLLGTGFLGAEPSSAEVLGKGEWRLDAVWSLANCWAISPEIDLVLNTRAERAPLTLDELEALAEDSYDGGSIFIDGEVSRLALSMRRGFGAGIELEIRVPVLDFTGGLDGAIEDFHERFDLARDGRPGATKDRFLIAASTRRGEVLIADAPSSGLGDVVVGAKVKLSGDSGARLRTALQLQVKLPTGGDEPIVSSGEIDVGLQLLANRQFSHWSLHGAAGVLFLGASERLGLDSQQIYSLLTAIEVPAGERTRFVLQVGLAESPFESWATTRIDEDTSHATIGFARRIGRHNELFLAATENFDNFTNTADISLHLGFSSAIR